MKKAKQELLLWLRNVFFLCPQNNLDSKYQAVVSQHVTWLRWWVVAYLSGWDLSKYEAKFITKEKNHVKLKITPTEINPIQMRLLCGVHYSYVLIFPCTMLNVKFVYCVHFLMLPIHNQISNIIFSVFSPARSYQNNEHMNDWNACNIGHNMVMGSHPEYSSHLML